MSSGESAPDVSVIVPIYNKAKYLGACLESVLSQTGPTFEIICIDDGSDDESGNIATSYAVEHDCIRLFTSSSRRGAAHSRNVGIEKARGRYLQFTDADDILTAGALAALHSAAVKTGAEAVRGNLEVLRNGVTQPWTTEKNVAQRCGSLLELRELWIPWFHICYLISRDLLVRCGARYPDLIAGEDVVFMAQVLMAARLVCSIPNVTYLYRQDEPRAQPTLKTAEDYLSHAVMIKEIFAGEYSPCWHAYRRFIRDDIRLLLRQANVTAEEYESIERRVESL